MSEPLFWGLTEPVLWFSVLTFFIGLLLPLTWRR